MVVSADTSFLFSLYGNDGHTPRAVDWLRESRRVISVSEFADYELGNALRFAEFAQRLRPGRAATYWALYEAARAAGRVRVEVCNFAEILREAKRLSATYTLAGGHRGFDILQVAGALRMRSAEFLTFDLNQKRLAEAEGLTVPL